jgi:hypothetical protein
VERCAGINVGNDVGTDACAPSSIYGPTCPAASLGKALAFRLATLQKLALAASEAKG